MFYSRRKLVFFITGFLAHMTAANVEKAIFLGPEPINVPHQGPTLDDLDLPTLTPEIPSIQTYLHVASPLSGDVGRATWLVLENLSRGRRYEVRVCWAATQPTAFTLKTHEVPVVWDSPGLISSLGAYVTARIEETVGSTSIRPRSAKGEHVASYLLLQILAAADYFTDNATLMREAPPVHVDIILDPFVLNVLPQSLVPTVIYVLAVSVVFWYIARLASTWVQDLAASGSKNQVKKKQ